MKRSFAADRLCFGFTTNIVEITSAIPHPRQCASLSRPRHDYLAFTITGKPISRATCTAWSGPSTTPTPTRDGVDPGFMCKPFAFNLVQTGITFIYLCMCDPRRSCDCRLHDTQMYHDAMSYLVSHCSHSVCRWTNKRGTSCLQQARASTASFSDRKPYPGCTASAPVCSIALMIASMLR